MRKRQSELRHARAEEHSAGGRERLFEQILARLRQGVVVVDRRLVVQYANPAYEQLIGARPVTGRLLDDRWPGFSLRDFAASSLEAGPSNAEIVSVDDRIIACEGVRSGAHIILVVEDVTERERIRRTEHEFLENVAHELRTPLAAIISVMDVLESGAKDVPEVRDRFLTHIRVHSDRLSRLATSFLTLARIKSGLEAPRVELIAVEPILRGVADDLDSRAGVKVVLDVPADAATVGDPELLHRVIANLAENAAKHTHRGEIVIAAQERGENLEIEVRDTGSGMTEPEVEQAFDRFYRATDDGSGFGLGLAIAEESARALGGRLEMDSAAGAGTRVRLVLPAAYLVAS